MGFWDKVKDYGGYAIPGYNLYKIGKETGANNWIEQNLLGGKERDANDAAKESMRGFGDQAGQFANQAQSDYAQLGAASNSLRDRFGQLMEGKDSLAAEQLRQGVQQGLSAQRSLAASGGPNAVMAARQAAQNMGRLSSGLSGQAATAGIQERQAAANSLSNLLMNQRAQELQGLLQGRNQALSAYGGQIDPNAKGLGAYVLPAIGAVAGGMAGGPAGAQAGAGAGSALGGGK